MTLLRLNYNAGWPQSFTALPYLAALIALRLPHA